MTTEKQLTRQREDMLDARITALQAENRRLREAIVAARIYVQICAESDFGDDQEHPMAQAARKALAVARAALEAKA